MVSIIIPHYNRSVLLKDTVNSVITQTSADWELIIVDDGSNMMEYDKILLLKEKDHRITVLKRNAVNKGPSACRNQGVAAAKGKFLLFLDSDDLLESFCIEQRIQLMNKYPELDMGIFLMAEFTNVKSDSTRIYNSNSNNNNRVHCFLEGNNPWAVTCPIWKKDFFIKCGGFDESFLYMEDPDLHVRALLKPGMSYQTFYEFPADCFYRVNYHDDTKKRFYENSIRYRIQFYKKVGMFISGDPKLVGKYRNSFEKGVMVFFRDFLLSRVKEYPQLLQQFNEWTKGNLLLHPMLVFRWRLLAYIYLKDNILFRKLRLKGIARKILIPTI